MTLPAPVIYRQKEPFRRGLVTGVMELGKSAGDALHFIGAEQTGNRVRQGAESKIEENRLPSGEDRWPAFEAGRITPILGLSYLTGMGGGAAATGLGAGSRAATLAGSVAGGAPSGLTKGMNTYRQELESGKSETDARISGAMMGIGATALNAMPAYHLFKEGQKPLQKVGAEIGNRATKFLTQTTGKTLLERLAR